MMEFTIGCDGADILKNLYCCPIPHKPPRSISLEPPPLCKAFCATVGIRPTENARGEMLEKGHF